MQGIHVHCPEGATPKDGPSAGAAITLALYSAVLEAIRDYEDRNCHGTHEEEGAANVNRSTRVRPWVAMTGEINLRGEVGEIGGLESKILGGLGVGIREFIYPKENERDMECFQLRHGARYDSSVVTFKAVTHIREIVQCMMVP